ncbi:MAG: hypothetical protein WAX89_06275, partial [Alphaproteobacteria bacterium]
MPNNVPDNCASIRFVTPPHVTLDNLSNLRKVVKRVFEEVYDAKKVRSDLIPLLVPALLDNGELQVNLDISKYIDFTGYWEAVNKGNRTFMQEKYAEFAIALQEAFTDRFGCVFLLHWYVDETTPAASRVVEMDPYL